MTEVNLKAATVVCICGFLAAGKTTLIRGLSDKHDGAAVLIFDEYGKHCEWPKDFAQWISQGADPSCVGNPRLRQDLESLLAGQSIQHPLDEHTISSSPVILLEDPFGRTRPDIKDLIDLVLFVDLPTDLSVLRLAQRALGLDSSLSHENLSGLPKDDLVQRIGNAQRKLDDYARHRVMYTTLIQPVRATADVILDAMKPAEAVYEDALAAIEQWLEPGSQEGDA